MNGSHEGRLVCFCGIDGSGKSTHLRLIRQTLKARGYSVKAIRLITRRGAFFRCLEPLIGQIPDQLYCDIFVFQRHLKALTRLRRELMSYDSVLCDRYLLCDQAYTIGYGCKTDTINLMVKRVPQPDLILLFDVPAEIASLLPTGQLDFFALIR